MPRKGAKGEGDGYVMAIASNYESMTSDLVIADAQKIEEGVDRHREAAVPPAQRHALRTGSRRRICRRCRRRISTHERQQTAPVAATRSSRIPGWRRLCRRRRGGHCARAAVSIVHALPAQGSVALTPMPDDPSWNGHVDDACGHWPPYAQPIPYNVVRAPESSAADVFAANVHPADYFLLG